MGNEQSTQRKRQKANTVEKNVQNGEMNGHAVPPPDSPEPVASKEAVVQQKCEIPPETDVKNPEPSAGKEEVDSNKANKPAHVETTPEKEMTAATDAEPKKEAQKLIEKEVTNIFGKMFKKKSEPVKSAAQSNAAVDGQVKVADLKIDLQTDSAFINTGQEKILEEVVKKFKLQSTNTISEDSSTDSSLLTKNIPLVSSRTDVETATCLKVLPDGYGTQEPVDVAEEPLIIVEESANVSEEPVVGNEEREMHVEHQKAVEEGSAVNAKVPISLEYEESKNAGAEQAMIEDKELIKMVEIFISDTEELLTTENVPESALVNGEECLASEAVSEKCIKVTDQIDSVTVNGISSDTVDTVEVLSHVEEPVVGNEEPLFVAEEIAAIVKEILQITEDQILGAEASDTGMEEPGSVTQEQIDIPEETMGQINKAEEPESVLKKLILKNNINAEEPESISVEPALIVEEQIAPVTVRSILLANRTAAIDEESWVIIEEPAQLTNISVCADFSHPSCVEEPTPLQTESKHFSTESEKLLSQLRSVCTKALEDASYKPVSVDICAVESTIHNTIEFCMTDKNEFTCANKVSDNRDVVTEEENDFTHKIQENFVHCSTESVDIKTSTESEPEPKEKTLESILVEVAEEIYPSEDIKEAEKTVMNFFKTFVSPTKTSKEAKATPDASKDQPQKETPPAPSTNVQEVPKAPPPPPPAPPKMENKAEPVVKKEETPAAAATKASDSSTKTKPKDSAFSKLFRPKPVVVGEKKPVEVQQQVDASKTSTLEAAAKPEEPPAPKPEEKKKEKKSTIGMFKPKVLLSQLSTRIQAAASSAAASITLAAGSAPEPKKETPAAPAVVEVAPAVKAKEEPKPATPAPPAAPDNKSVASSANASPNIPRKLEKRNSMQLFFKNLVK